MGCREFLGWKEIKWQVAVVVIGVVVGVVVVVN